MKNIIALLIVLTVSYTSIAQTGLRIIVKNEVTREPIPGTTIKIKETEKFFVADAKGVFILSPLPANKATLHFTAAGYEPITKHIDFTKNFTDSLIIYLEPGHEEMEEVIVSSTRTGRTIGNVPTRVEVIDLEEIEEKINMRAANVSMLLHESTGIQIQQTSATSQNFGIRIQGLDGRYTQVIKDGYPNFGNFASGLSVLDIPPLDLAQVEVIKGPASTLYGGGAIAGVVDFISKTPQLKPEHSFVASQSHIGQTTLGGFSAGRNNKWGYTFLAQLNLQKPYDVDKDEFTEIAKSQDFTLHPKLFYYPSNHSYLMIGNSLTKGSRTGGDMQVIKGKADATHTYFETNNTLRNSTNAEYETKLGNDGKITAKTSFSYYDRDILMKSYNFGGRNYNSFTDVTYSKKAEHQTLIVGGNYIYDNFKEKQNSGSYIRDFKMNTGGLYAQHTWDINDGIVLETGLRSDLVKYGNNLYSKTELFVLPRASVLFHLSEKLTSRIGGGLGYKTPTTFTEETETLHYRNVAPLNGVKAERSFGGTADVNYKTYITDDLQLSLNYMFFYTRINNAMVLQSLSSGDYNFINANKPVNSTGVEVNLKLIYKHVFKVFSGYTFTHAKATYLTGNQFIPLVAKNRVNLMAIYETKNFKTGFEGYFSDWQYLTDGSKAPSFWDLGFMIEKRFGAVSVFVNAENFTDARQNRIKSVVNGSHNNPSFDDIWSYHPEGRVISAGVKLKL